jgi:hypothetical protein
MRSLLLVIGLITTASCASALLNPDTLYKKDLKICESEKCFEGVGTLPFKGKYKFEVESLAKIDILFLQTNHREVVIENPKVGKGIIKDNKKAEVSFTSNAVDKIHAIYFTALNEKNGKHSWGMLIPRASTATCEMLCNGKKIVDSDILCQSKSGTVARLMTVGKHIANDAACILNTKADSIDFLVQQGLCARIIMKEDKTYCTVYVFGYEEIPVRGE